MALKGQDEAGIIWILHLNYWKHGYDKSHPYKEGGYISCYLNEDCALVKAGLMVEQLVGETNNETLTWPAEFSSGHYTPYKAKRFPLSFIIKARKV